MTQVLRHNRKITDSEILRMNGVGLSLATIAKTRDCHPSSISLRLDAMNVPAANTRRAFMEEIFMGLEPEIQESLADHMTPPDGSPPTTTLKQLVASLITEKFKASHP